jgi:hypothetical protein
MLLHVSIGLAAATFVAKPAAALPGFQKDLRPVRDRGKVDISEYRDGPEGLK